MLDFLARKAAALRASAQWFALVIVTQTFTAITTGIATGYLLMFPCVWFFAICNANQVESRPRHSRDYAALESFVAAFNDQLPIDERCVDPNRVFWFTSLLGIGSTAALILGVSVYERRRLRSQGGWAIGLAIGGRPIESPSGLDEKQLVNVVEEIAVAYSTLPPTIFLLDHESGINAFAAGLTPHESILGVTLGAIKQLDRDELQAVVAHEMSHLTNGDTVLGTRLTCILSGLQSIRVVSECLVSEGYDTFQHSEDNGGYGLVSIIIGAVIWPFGVFGTFAATALVMALGRSRETLADAEAVEKTRHPEPLARALRRIKGHPNRGEMHHPMTTLVAPMLFVERSRNHHWFSSHPPIHQRIAAITPNGDQSPIYADVNLDSKIDGQSPEVTEIMNLVFAGAMLTSATSHPAAKSTSPKSSSSPQVRTDSDAIKASALVVLSTLAVCDGESAMSDYEFLRGWNQLGLGDAKRLPASEISTELFDHAVDSLAHLPLPKKKRLLAAIADTITSDGSMSEEEATILDALQNRFAGRSPAPASA
ncbi:hypothetical protein K227x_00600 [Rubripirellula lacrimiformis]|uniref:Peptidase M48 domain-containing protein n=1 Tax=Rubripirellula lacrimiformis TaxID=1930273 RepID=A0A517N3I4_9BACT|nr:M48 family metalloprotease [Rubripirellula lacrimiformis]QDT01693.1 hypothetical protein K227x_00600 [Rubripirellula lacrimiformis]